MVTPPTGLPPEPDETWRLAVVGVVVGAGAALAGDGAFEPSGSHHPSGTAQEFLLNSAIVSLWIPLAYASLVEMKFHPPVEIATWVRSLPCVLFQKNRAPAGGAVPVPDCVIPPLCEFHTSMG
jgi:hypothetical protein